MKSATMIYRARLLPNEWFEAYARGNTCEEGLRGEAVERCGVDPRLTGQPRGEENAKRRGQVDRELALHLLGRGVTEHLERWVEKAHTQGASPKEEVDQPVPRRSKLRRRDWVTNW